jgi:hypothetical protein
MSDVMRSVPDSSANAGTATAVDSANAVVSLVSFWNIFLSLLFRSWFQIMKLDLNY